MTIYQSRLLLDPSFLNEQLKRQSQEMAERNRQRSQYYDRMSNAIGGGLKNLGQIVSNELVEYGNKSALEREQEKRKDLTRSLLNSTDPLDRAVAEEYTRTGNASPMLQRQMAKDTLNSRIEENKRKEIENARKEEYNKILQQSQLRPQYEEAIKKMQDAYDNGDYEMGDVYKSTANSISEKAGTNWGIDVNSVSDARKKSSEEKAIAAKQLDFENALDAEKQKQFENKSYEMRNFILENFMPVGSIKNKNEQIYLAGLVKNNANLTDDDKKYLLDKIYSETKEEKRALASEKATEQYASEQTKKGLEDKDIEKELDKYIGQILNSLEWNKLDDKIKSKLKRDGKGLISKK